MVFRTFNQIQAVLFNNQIKNNSPVLDLKAFVPYLYYHTWDDFDFRKLPAITGYKCNTKLLSRR